MSKNVFVRGVGPNTSRILHEWGNYHDLIARTKFRRNVARPRWTSWSGTT
jgi:hypothetical protein